MQRTEHVFHFIAGTNITTKNVLQYAIGLAEHFNSKVKIERAYKRKVDRLIDAAHDVQKVTDRLLDNIQVKELTEIEADEIEKVLYLACGLTAAKRTKVINYINHLNKEDRVLVSDRIEIAQEGEQAA
jgi:DNA-binding protein